MTYEAIVLAVILATVGLQLAQTLCDALTWFCGFAWRWLWSPWR